MGKPNGKLHTALKKTVMTALCFVTIFSTVFFHSFDAAADTKIPLQSARYTDAAYLIYIDTTNETIASYNPNKIYNMASVSKLMTCLIAAEKLNLNDYYQVDGEENKVSVEELLYRALLPSDSNAAAALANAVSGSREEFVVLMNDRAKKLGCKNTDFGNASGLYGMNKSTCEDIVKIAAAAFKNETVAKIASTAHYTLKESMFSESHEIENSNYFLEGGSYKATTGRTLEVEEYPEVLYGKTGTTEDSHTTMVVSADFYGLRIYVVIMNSTWDYRYEDVKRLLDFAKENIQAEVVFSKGEKFAPGKIWKGKENLITGEAKSSGIINLPEGASKSLITTEVKYFDKLEAPIQKGEVIGIASIKLGDETMRKIDIVASESVQKGWILSAIRITNKQTIILLISVAVLFAIAAVIVIIRKINQRRRMRERRKRLMDAAKQRMNDEASRNARNWPYY